jgi:endoglucanase
MCSLVILVTRTAHSANLLTNSTFENGQAAPWESYFDQAGGASGQMSVRNGELCVDVTNVGTQQWNVQVRYRSEPALALQEGHTYSISFKAYASKPTTIYAKIGNQGAPYAEFWNQRVNLTTTPQTFTGSFTMTTANDLPQEFAFHMGKQDQGTTATPPFSVCLDDIVLDDPQFTPDPTPEPVVTPDVRLNQVGYVPISVKRATVVSAATRPLGWELLNAEGQIVGAGRTTVFGKDAASGDHVHIVDFSSFRRVGSGYTLWVGDEASHPFDIRPDIYSTMKYDALRYFYHNRSGIAITMPYAGGEQWTRPAGHINVPPNKGDNDVPCAPNTGCTYSLDVTGGWYDAGDHGKYVVNGGISVWTLLNQYERTIRFGRSHAALRDGALNIPESGNGVPDILDEARWELEFFFKMQVPEGQPKAGMVHHKIHDENWTGLPLRPDQDPQQRYLRPPSTAATLNVAATAAQCARIWKQIDPPFAATCLAVAERTWQAAVANPAIYAPASDGTGGGPYNDNNVTDEFYWAAAELFITTGQDAYREFMTQSPHYLKVPTTFENGEPGMTWGTTQALGTISLAVVPSTLANDQIAAARNSIIAAADAFAQIHDQQGYGTPFAPGPDGKYPWGSNSFVINNMLIMALAHDFTDNARYLNTIRAGMDYILGRNAMDKSYVSGYGENPLRNPHHRFWAHQLDPSFPSPPPGAVSGGPNSSIQDPYAQPRLAGCAPQKCYIDHIESWSTNEITVNWNAPFAWVTAFLDENAGVVRYLPLVLRMNTQ